MSSQPIALTNTRPAKLDSSLLHGILEKLTDGVLIVTTDGEWVYGNRNANRICQQVSRSPLEPGFLPEAIWRICKLFLDRIAVGQNHAALLEAEIALEQLTRYRVRVRWFVLEETQKPHLMVTLEDCYQAARNRAIAEVRQYGLTARQSEVWQLYRTGHSYREIAERLYVTVNTIKRHMKDIHAKQKLNTGETPQTS